MESAPAAARALPKLAERARQEEWSYERFLQALLATETASRESSGGRLGIRAAHFPPINEGEPTTWSAFVYNFNRGQYGKPALFDRQAPFSGQLGMYWLYFEWQWRRDPNHPLKWRYVDGRPLYRVDAVRDYLASRDKATKPSQPHNARGDGQAARP